MGCARRLHVHSTDKRVSSVECEWLDEQNEIKPAAAAAAVLLVVYLLLLLNLCSESGVSTALGSATQRSNDP